VAEAPHASVPVLEVDALVKYTNIGTPA